VVGVWLAELRARVAAAGQEVEPNTYLFLSRKGRNRPICRRHALWVLRGCFDANELAGQLGTHSMRKTFANRVDRLACERRQAGAPVDPLRIVQRALGHKNINSTLSYLSFREEDVEECILGTVAVLAGGRNGSRGGTQA
jgi:integrase